MKNMKLSITLFLLLFTIFLNAQTKTVKNFIVTDSLVTVNYFETDNLGKKTAKVAYLYKTIKNQDDLKLAIKHNYFFDKNFHIEKDNKKDIVKLYENKIFNEAMLNVFFAEEVSSYIGESKDLSLKKSYAVISTADKTLFLGGSFIYGRKKKTQKLKHILTLGVKAKLNEEFASFLNNENGNLANEIGLNFKYTWIGRGILNYGCYKDELQRLNEKVLIPKYEEKVASTNKALTYVKELKEFENIYGVASSKYIDKRESYFSKKYEELYLELAEEEIAILKKENLYSYFWDHYITAEAFLPASRTFYSVVPSITTSTTKDSFENKGFYPWQVNLGYTSFWKTSTAKTLYLSGFISAFNNNNIAIETLESKNLQTFNATNSGVIESTDAFFLGDFNRFTTGSIKAEMVSYFIKKGTIGLSAAIEQNIGNHYNPLNWKLGIPVSLKDKEGKPTVNFEFQWREVNSDHFVGIGVGFAFGKFIK